MPTLPPFALTNIITADTAKQDRIHVTYGKWTIGGTISAIDNLRHFIAVPPVDMRGGEVEETSDWGVIFNRPQQRGGYRRPLSIRGEDLQLNERIIPPPLFSGQLDFSNYVNARGPARRTTTASIKLHINPTRFARYQQCVPMPHMVGDDPPWPRARLFPHRIISNFHGEQALDGNDNLIPNTLRYMAFTNPERWQRHLQTYFAAIPAELERELIRLQSSDDHYTDETYADYFFTWERESEEINLHSVETYWEWAAENPTGLVASIKPHFDTFTARERETLCFRQDCDTSIDRNALCLKAEINPSRAIRIYAKTNQRVRIEVTHTLGGEHGYRLTGGHTATAWSSLPRMLGSLAENATELVNELFAHFREMNLEVSMSAMPYELLMEICRSSGRDSRTASLIAHLLVQNRCIAPEGLEDRTRRALYRLSSAGILDYSPIRENYIVAPLYREALEVLRTSGTLSLMILRERSRVRP